MGKKVIGNIVLDINAEILELLKEYKNVKETVQLSAKGVKLEEDIGENRDRLVEILRSLDKNSDYVAEERFEKTVKMIKTNIETANKVINSKGKTEEVCEKDLQESIEEASEVIEEIEAIEQKAEEEIEALLNNLSSINVDRKVEENTDEKARAKDDDSVEQELQ